MKSALVGYTGVVGSNIKAVYPFTNLYNSKNIEEAYGTCPDVLVYAGLPAAMFKANTAPAADLADVKQAIANIKVINPERLVLISSVAVYDQTIGVDETHTIDANNLLPYGKNRLLLEQWVSENCKNSLIVRLPAIYGINLKKNFIYDYINLIPAMLSQEKFTELAGQSELVKTSYELKKDGFYHFSIVNNKEKKKIYEYFLMSNFNAISFTDSRSMYQFYNLKRLWSDIQIAMENGIRLLNIVTEPLNVAEIYEYLAGKPFLNEMEKKPYNYNIRSIHFGLFNGKDGYFMDKNSVLKDLKIYVEREKRKRWG